MRAPEVGLIGYGEVGRILARDLRAAGAAVSVYDLKFDAPVDDLRAAAEADAACVRSIAAAASGRALVISAVTAAAAEDVCREAADHLGSALFVDVNSVSPATRRRSAAALEARGGRYVEAAVMAPFPPQRLATPILLGGPHAEPARHLLTGLGFRPRVFSTEIGRASAVKMCRSVFVKGLESVVSESLLAARRYGVEAEVLASLSNTLPHEDWSGLARYLIGRTVEHGRRRSEEMREAAATVEEAGLPAWMSRGAVERQRWAADLMLGDAESVALDGLLDVMLSTAGAGPRPREES